MIMSLSTMKSAADGTAWKTPSMRGYVKKTVPSDAPAGTFDLDFINAAGDTFRYAWNGTKFTYSGYLAHGASNAVATTGTPSTATTLTFDEFLLGLVTGPELWTANTATAYDAARLNPATVTGEW